MGKVLVRPGCSVYSVDTWAKFSNALFDCKRFYEYRELYSKEYGKGKAHIWLFKKRWHVGWRLANG